MKTLMFIILTASVLFSLKIGSYFPESFNEVFQSLLEFKLGEVEVERVNSGKVGYDAVVSPFNVRGYRFSRTILSFSPVVFKSPFSERVLVPVRYFIMNSLMLAALKDVPYDVTSVEFPKTALKVLEKLRNMKKNGIVIPMFYDDPKSSLMMVQEKQYSFVGPVYLRPNVPVDYVEVSCRDFFDLPYKCPSVHVVIYSNKGSVISDIVMALMAAKDVVRSFGFSFVTEKSLNGLDISGNSIPCYGSCHDYVLPLAFLTFFSGDDLKGILEDYERAVNSRLWMDRFFEKAYFLTYLLLGLFVIMTVDLKMIRYVRYVKEGGYQKNVLYVTASLIPFVSVFGVLPDVCPLVSKVLFFSIMFSLLILDWISGNKRWWIPAIVNTLVAVFSLFNDRIFSAIDVPFIFAVSAFLSEDGYLRWFVPSIGAFFYFAAKRAEHPVYLIPSMIFTLILFEYFVQEYSKSKRESHGYNKVDRPVFILKLMHPIFFTLIFYIILSMFVFSFVKFESAIENVVYMERRSALRLAGDIRDVPFPAVNIRMDGDIQINRPGGFSMRAYDRGIAVSKGDEVFLSYVPRGFVIKNAFKGVAGYLYITLILVLSNIALYVLLGRYGDMSRIAVERISEERSRECMDVVENFRSDLEVKEKGLRMVEKVSKIFKPGMDIEELLLGVSKMISDEMRVEYVKVARLMDNGWISVEGERTYVPIPDLKLDMGRRFSISLRTERDVYALVVKLEEDEIFDPDIFRIVKINLENFQKFSGGLEV